EVQEAAVAHAPEVRSCDAIRNREGSGRVVVGLRLQRRLHQDVDGREDDHEPEGRQRPRDVVRPPRGHRPSCVLRILSHPETRTTMSAIRVDTTTSRTPITLAPPNWNCENPLT